MAVNDTPCLKNLKLIQDFKIYLAKYISFLTRVTGKGVSFIFLGCALLSAMYSNLDYPFFKFTGVVMNTFVLVVGCAAIAIGILKSKKLSICKEEFAKPSVIDTAFQQKCKQFP